MIEGQRCGAMARKSKRRPIWIADAETDPFRKGRVPAPFIWGLLDTENNEYFEFLETEAFVNFVREKKIVVYAHNGGRFDWHFITKYIGEYEPLTIIAGRLAKFKIDECEFRDSYNLIPAPLSAYKKDEIDYAIMEESERHKPENWEAIRKYLKADCVYLGEIVTGFIENYGLHLTQAGAAMNFWSKLAGIEKPNTTEFYYEKLKPYYYGGRVECFETGIIECDFNVVDITSAYPYAMTFKHPWGTSYTTYKELPNCSNEEIGRMFIDIRAKSLGAFPFRGLNGLEFPHDGQMRNFTITGWEYLAAKETGTLVDAVISRVIEFDDCIDFTEYVAHFFALKNEAKANADDAQYLFAKIFLNALYGKFASNPENYQEFMTVNGSILKDVLEDGWLYCKMIDTETAVVARQLQEEMRRYYDVSVSASITGFVRAHLWKNIKLTDRALYCDTDSIAAVGITEIPITDKLGDWENEGDFIKAAIGGKKLYAFERRNKTKADAALIKKKGKYKIASKGARLDASEIIQVANGAIITYEPEAPTFSVKRGIIFTPRKIRKTKKGLQSI